MAVNAADVLRPAVFVDAGRFPNRGAVESVPLDPRRINAGFGAGRENAPRCRDGFGRGGRGGGGAAAARRENDVGEATGLPVENKVFNFADILALRILDFGTDDVATLNVTRRRRCGGGALGLSEERSTGETHDGQSCSYENGFFHML